MSGPAGHAARRPDGQHRDRRRQPDHRRRDRPDQQAVAADRGGRALAGAARGRSSSRAPRSRSAWRSRRGAVETVAVAAGLAVGALYSLPPFRLKRFPVAASLCITGVRSLVVNLGVYWHFAGRDRRRRCGHCACSSCRSASRSRCSRTCPDIEGDRRVQHPHLHGPPRRPAGVPDRFGRAGDRVRGDDLRRAVRARRLRSTRGSGRRPSCGRRAALVLVTAGGSTRPRRGSRASTCAFGHSSSWSICWCPSRALRPDARWTSGREQAPTVGPRGVDNLARER